MMRFFDFVFRWVFVLTMLFFLVVVLPWKVNSQTQAELADANAVIKQLEYRLEKTGTSDYTLELTNEVCILGVWTLRTDTFTIHTDRTTFESCCIGDNYPCRSSLDSFLLTTRLVITGMEEY